MGNTNKSITFAVFNERFRYMKHIIELTETEWDLIETVRNYKRSFPNGEPRLRYYINRLFAELLDEPLED